MTPDTDWQDARTTGNLWRRCAGMTLAVRESQYAPGEWGWTCRGSAGATLHPWRFGYLQAETACADAEFFARKRRRAIDEAKEGIAA